MRNVIIVGKDSVDSKLTLAGDEGADALMSNSPSARPTLEDVFALLLAHDEGEEKREVPLPGTASTTHYDEGTFTWVFPIRVVPVMGP